MPSDDAIRPASHPALIRTPDQVQQAKRPDAPRPVDGRREPEGPPQPRAGVLGQLETERGHD